MARVEASVVINRPLEEVFAFASNHENGARWASGMLEAEQTTDGSIGVGARFRGVLQFFGQRIEWASEVTAYQANRKVEFKIDAGPLMLKESLAFEPVEGGTRVTLADQGEPGGFVGVPKRIAVRIWKRQVEGNLAKLKDILEAQAEAAG